MGPSRPSDRHQLCPVITYTEHEGKDLGAYQNIFDTVLESQYFAFPKIWRFGLVGSDDFPDFTMDDFWGFQPLIVMDVCLAWVCFTWVIINDHRFES